MEFKQSSLVQLRAGGPLMVVVTQQDSQVNCIYHNPVTGLFTDIRLHEATLRLAATPPSVPDNVASMRSSPTNVQPHSAKHI